MDRITIVQHGARDRVLILSPDFPIATGSTPDLQVEGFQLVTDGFFTHWGLFLSTFRGSHVSNRVRAILPVQRFLTLDLAC